MKFEYIFLFVVLIFAQKKTHINLFALRLDSETREILAVGQESTCIH